MPFTAKDAKTHTKKATTAKQQTRWAKVANSVRDSCMKDGGSETHCDAEAIKRANGVIAEMEEKSMPDIRQIAESAIEMGLATLTGETKTSEVERLHYLEKLQADMAALSETTEGASTPDVDAQEFGFDMPSSPVFAPTALTFADMAAADAANETADNVRELARRFQRLFDNVMFSEEIDDKMGAVRGLVDELAVLMGETPTAESEGEMGESDFAESAGGGIISLAESTVEAVVPLSLDIAIIQPGFGNERDNNYYSEKMLRRDAPRVFAGMKMYETDHRPNEKSTRTWVSTITDVPGFTELGEPIGRVAVHDEGFAKRLIALNEAKDKSGKSLLEKMACSILAKGRRRKGEINGRATNIVEAITSASSVDWVTKAGAGGRALNLAETEEGTVNDNDGERIEGEQPEPEPTPEPTPDAAPEPEATPTEAEPVEEVFLSEAAIAPILAEAKLPEQAKERLQVGQYKDDDALKEAVQAEADYIKAVTGAGKPVVPQGRTPEPPKQRTLAERHEAMDAVNKKYLGG